MLYLSLGDAPLAPSVMETDCSKGRVRDMSQCQIDTAERTAGDRDEMTLGRTHFTPFCVVCLVFCEEPPQSPESWEENVALLLPSPLQVRVPHLRPIFRAQTGACHVFPGYRSDAMRCNDETEQCGGLNEARR